MRYVGLEDFMLGMFIVERGMKVELFCFICKLVENERYLFVVCYGCYRNLWSIKGYMLYVDKDLF